MTDKTDRRPHDDEAARHFYILEKAESLSLRARRDRRSVAKEAAAEAAERRYAWETRRRPGYTSVEAQRPFEPETRLIRREDEPDEIKAEQASEPPSRPTYAEMRAQRDEYPGQPRAVYEYKRRKREQRRAREGQQKSNRGRRRK